MNRRIPLIIFGLVGTAILISLGVWQFQRMTWKNNILAEIDARLAQAPVALPATLNPVADKYLQVEVTGMIAEGELHVLTFGDSGPGFRVIAPMVLEDGRRILVDRGFVPETEKITQRSGGAVTAMGSLVWPQETDSFIPDPNLEKNIWFARDVELMAQVLKTDQVMLAISRSTNNDGITPQLVSVNISNKHLEYVMTWFSLAAIWIGMTGYALSRIKPKAS
ncbi:MAG: cytochrome oxidase biogenesis protein Surf1, facilitates heme A insertion [Rhodobacteraceae bacterium]|nr:MAG: cytochrome oxidase biogenesis protein Surf1, facilitates heme A insertion [Paracoccaceae bacterium]